MRLFSRLEYEPKFYVSCENYFMPVPNNLLIIANSGRLLAESAQRAGYSPWVIDRFGDCDTEQWAQGVWGVEQLTIECLQAVLDEVARKYPIEQVVVGSGFEDHTDSLAWLQSRFLLLGNANVKVKAISNPVEFSQTLRRLQINHPETRFSPPERDFQRWLIKPMASEGGVGVMFYQGQLSEQKNYWQRYQQGQIYSALFVANAQETRLIGFSRQWVTTDKNDQVFMFSGVINNQEANLRQHSKAIQTWIDKLTVEYALLGLNGIDFIIRDDHCWLLEINPRPTASMALYVQELDLFNLHINACNGHLPEKGDMQTTQIRAYQIIYANASLAIPADLSWPEWASDRPKPGAIIDTQQPICSIIASAKTAESVLRTLQSRTQIINQLLYKEAFSTCTLQPALISYPSL